MNPLLLDFPEEFSTERLLIRAARAGDGKALNEAVHESWPELQEWMPWAKKLPTLAESETNIRQACVRWQERSDLRLLIFDRDGKMVGNSGLHRIDWEVPRFEIGYWLRSSCTGQGFMTEAVSAITKFAFDELKARRVEIRCDEENFKSIAVARRCDFHLEATLHNWGRRTNGKLHNTLVYARILNETI